MTKLQTDINSASISPRAMRDACGCFATGVTVVTAMDTTGAVPKPVGITVNSFSSVSLDPPLVQYCLGLDAFSYRALSEADYFIIHFLNSEQQNISNQFASQGHDKFKDIPWETSLEGSPLLSMCKPRFECRKHAIYEGGDHMIILGEVMRLTCDQTQEEETANPDPLIYYKGAYRGIE